MKIKRPRKPAQPVAKDMVRRSVASSTAIETGQSVKAVEAKLKSKRNKFSHLDLSARSTLVKIHCALNACSTQCIMGS